VRLVASRNRLVLLHAAGVATFNTSNPLKLAGSNLVSHTWQDLWQLYGLGKHYSQQQQQQQVELQEAAKATDSSSSSANSCAGSLMHSTAWDTDTPLPAAAVGGLLLLPLGHKVVAVFSTARVQRGLGGGASGVGFSGSDYEAPVSLDWVRFLQPLVIIMMVVVGVWQFLRASNKQQLSSQRGGMGSRYSGLEGLNPDDLRSLGMSGLGLGGGRGDFGSLDTQFGAYAGPRSNREREIAFDPYGGLGALGARRRARQAMQGRERGSVGGSGFGSGSSRGLATSQGGGLAGGSMAGVGSARAAAAAAGGGVGVRGVLASSSRGSGGGAAAVAGRRVRFSEEEVAAGTDSGSDDIGRVPAAAMQCSMENDMLVEDLILGAEEPLLGAVDGGGGSPGGMQQELAAGVSSLSAGQQAVAAVEAGQQQDGDLGEEGAAELLESAASVDHVSAAEVDAAQVINSGGDALEELRQ
jgi:hypothetical protein